MAMSCSGRTKADEAIIIEHDNLFARSERASAILPEIAAPEDTPMSHPPRTMPRHSSLPKKMTRKSLTSRTCAHRLQAPMYIMEAMMGSPEVMAAPKHEKC